MRFRLCYQSKFILDVKPGNDCSSTGHGDVTRQDTEGCGLASTWLEYSRIKQSYGIVYYVQSLTIDTKQSKALSSGNSKTDSPHSYLWGLNGTAVQWTGVDLEGGSGTKILKPIVIYWFTESWINGSSTYTQGFHSVSAENSIETIICTGLMAGSLQVLWHICDLLQEKGALRAKPSRSFIYQWVAPCKCTLTCDVSCFLMPCSNRTLWVETCNMFPKQKSLEKFDCLRLGNETTYKSMAGTTTIAGSR